jgi:hypothetical protein
MLQADFKGYDQLFWNGNFMLVIYNYGNFMLVIYNYVIFHKFMQNNMKKESNNYNVAGRL